MYHLFSGFAHAADPILILVFVWEGGGGMCECSCLSVFDVCLDIVRMGDFDLGSDEGNCIHVLGTAMGVRVRSGTSQGEL